MLVEVAIIGFIDVLTPSLAVPWRQVLLLGAGESGKSTFGKQLKMLTKGSLAEGEKVLYRKGACVRVFMPVATLPERHMLRTLA